MPAIITATGGADANLKLAYDEKFHREVKTLKTQPWNGLRVCLGSYKV